MPRQAEGLAVYRKLVYLHLLLFTPVFAQETLVHASVSGRVTDPTGAVISGSEVTARHLETNVISRTTTGTEGRYRFSYLRVGAYEIAVHQPGFAPAARRISLTVGSAFDLPFALSVESRETNLVVSTDAAVLETSRSQVAGTVTHSEIRNLPLNGRNYLQLAQFTAGVLPGGGIGAGSRARDEGAFSAVGMQIAQNNVLLDGTDNSSRTSGGPLGYEAQQVKPPVDAPASSTRAGT